VFHLYIAKSKCQMVLSAIEYSTR